ncbi:MAG TPA: bifunctional DNA-formamidopyrimidine glycosylase/DNA-(apurinic or apyrimidinic site) lyase [Pseudomonadales bacterium]
MPELPEVETSRRGIEPHILHQQVTAVQLRQKQLRWPIPTKIKSLLPGQRINSVERRAKYLLLGTELGTLIIHLGMSGSLRILDENTPHQKHDHVDIVFGNHKILRLRDPRRFGAVLWTSRPVERHKLIKELGPEPLSDAFNGDYLQQLARGRKVSIKSFIMNSHVVVGVGNIYASEALFLAGINPKRSASRISLARYRLLAECIRDVLARAIEQGGTTLRDFTGEDGKPGYFQQTLNVYGRAGMPCRQCRLPIKQIRQQQRSSFYCAHCQC